MAVRELLNVVNFFHEALVLAYKGEESNLLSSSYGFGSQVGNRFRRMNDSIN